MAITSLSQYLLLLLLPHGTINCSDSSNLSTCHIFQTNIDLEHELFTHFLTDESNYYIFGVIEKDIRDFRTKEITIEQANVGDEQNWTLFSESIPGSCQVVCQTEKNIYLISRQQYQESQNPKYSKHVLYRISKRQRNIVELHKWEEGNSFVSDIFFDSDDKGFVFFRPSGNPLDFQIFSTVNGGKEWSVKDLMRPVRATQINDDKLYFLSYKNNSRADWLYSIDKNSNNLDSVQFDLNIIDFAVDEKGNYWLLGKNGDQTVLQEYKEGKAIDIKIFSEDVEFFADKLYKYHDLIVVLAGRVDKNMLGGFGGTKPEMHLSKNGGSTWSNQSMDKASYMKPVSFYEGNRMTAYIGQGQVIICNFK